MSEQYANWNDCPFEPLSEEQYKAAEERLGIKEILGKQREATEKRVNKNRPQKPTFTTLSEDEVEPVFSDPSEPEEEASAPKILTRACPQIRYKKFCAEPPEESVLDRADWWDGKHFNEVRFASEFVHDHPLKCVNGQLFSVDGKLRTDDPIRTMVYNAIKPYILSNLPARVGTLVETIKRECSVPELSEGKQLIHLANGTMEPDGTFDPEKQVCRFRLPVEFNPNAPEPTRFFRFLEQLFYPEDLPVVQEYVGYCLLPVTSGQKMLLVIGRGGEGKSTFGGVLTALFGSASLNSSIHMLEASRFNMAELEDKLVMIDDDMKLDSLPSTNRLKTLVTAIDPLQVERKGIQPYLAKLYCRVIGFGNYSLESFNDSSVGFFRRQIILKTKLPEKGRKTDPNLLSEMKEELGGILNWAIEGMQRLVANNYRFSVSERAMNNLREVMLEANNIPEFMASQGITDVRAISANGLYASYIEWCELNGEEPLIRKRFTKFMKENSERYGLKYSKNLSIGGSTVRGFMRTDR